MLTKHDAITFRGRGIPYVETFEEQTARRFWQSDPFSVARSVIDRLLADHDNDQPPFLIRKDPGEPEASSTGCEHFFDALYMRFSIDVYDHLILRDKSPTDKHCHFLLRLAYRGSDFCGWQTQPNNKELPSVQGTLNEWLMQLEGSKVNVAVCGRTDAGVNALGQVARYRSRNRDLLPIDVLKHISSIPQKGLKCLDVWPVARSFHPSFGAQARAYMYLLDVASIENHIVVAHCLDQQLRSLEGHTLDYISLSYGRVKTQTTDCTIYHARARLVEDPTTGFEAIAVELVGDRFLRRMVRMLVENSIRIAVRLDDQSDDTLLHHIKSRDRTRSGNACPPDGLIFVGASFEDPRR